ncbi:hypothetical protein NMY3_01203 [Candidatus Nitrosocosmicus oleophilus]|uniref:Uncharacterized protein n=1 Tax=Candidatus Nitrosocosmicus oleophilus TaxID=1353260 RepID=A0A654LVE8_9ARCH|nr:hypothetical protein NMY3_01203 [Candidatus Nitrosocosmicus oleophilus]
MYTRPDCNRLLSSSISSIIIILVYPSFLNTITGPTNDNRLVVFHLIHSGYWFSYFFNNITQSTRF